MRKNYGFESHVRLVLGPILFLWPSTVLVGSDETAVSSIKDRVELKVAYSPIYEDSTSVRVRYQVSNNSTNDIILTDGTLKNIKVTLEAPGGSRQRPYPYDPFTNAKLTIETIHPGHVFSSSFDLAIWFPFDKIGEYKCTFTQRVYVKDSSIVPTNSLDKLGRSLDLTSPVFAFRVVALSAGPARSRTLRGMLPPDELDGLSDQAWYNTVANETPKKLLEPAAQSSTQVHTHDAMHPQNADVVHSHDSGNMELWIWLILIIGLSGTMIWVMRRGFR